MPGQYLLRVRESRACSAHTRAVVLDLAGSGFQFAAGQAVTARLENHAVEKPYSIACTPDQAAASGCLELLVSVASATASRGHLGFAGPGSMVSVRGPMGAFVLPDRINERRLLLMAGGSGIAPLRAHLWDALGRGTPRDIVVVYSARTPEDFPYGEELGRLRDEGRVTLVQTVTRAAGPGWHGRRGRIDRAWIPELVPDAATLVSVCGPGTFVADVGGLLLDAGLPDAQILRERH